MKRLLLAILLGLIAGVWLARPRSAGTAAAVAGAEKLGTIPAVPTPSEPENGGRIHTLVPMFTPKRERRLRSAIFAVKHALKVGIYLVAALLITTLLQAIATPDFTIDSMLTPEFLRLLGMSMVLALAAKYLQGRATALGVEAPPILTSVPLPTVIPKEGLQ